MISIPDKNATSSSPSPSASRSILFRLLHMTFDYQAVTHYCPNTKGQKSRKGRGPKIKTKLVSFCFRAWAQETGLFKHGPSFRRISGTGSSCPQQHDAHLLLNKLRKTRQNTVGETRSENYGLLKAAFAAVLTARKQYSSPQIFSIYFADSEPHAIIQSLVWRFGFQVWEMTA